jgi:hypothetical protein
MQNDRPIHNPQIQKALTEIRQILRRYGFAGACMVIGPEEAAYTYKLDAAWSGIRLDAFTPMGFRIRVNSAEDGVKVAAERAEGAIHTICQLSDFGSQTMDWMEQLKAMLRTAGIDFDHTPHGGRPLPSLTNVAPDDQQG